MTRTAVIENRLRSVSRQRTSPRASSETLRRVAQGPTAPSDAGASSDRALDRLHADLLAARSRLIAADNAFTADQSRFLDLKRQLRQARAKLRDRYRLIHRPEELAEEPMTPGRLGGFNVLILRALAGGPGGTSGCYCVIALSHSKTQLDAWWRYRSGR